MLNVIKGGKGGDTGFGSLEYLSNTHGLMRKSGTTCCSGGQDTKMTPLPAPAALEPQNHHHKKIISLSGKLLS